MFKKCIIFHRGLGSDDESATIEEGSERLLLYYNNHSSSTSLIAESTVRHEQQRQLSTVSMLESLIEFANKFSREMIQTVRMRDHTWAFFQCEPEIWMALSVRNEAFTLSNSPFFTEQPEFDMRQLVLPRHGDDHDGVSVQPLLHSSSSSSSSSAAAASDNVDVDASSLLLILQRMYELFVCFHGSFGDILAHRTAYQQINTPRHIDEDQVGWSLIGRVKATRKTIRKLKHQLEQVERDVESAVYHQQQEQLRHSNDNHNDNDDDGCADLQITRDPSITIADLTSTLEALRNEIKMKQSLLTSLLSDNTLYTPCLLRTRLSQFARWFLSKGAMTSWSASDPHRLLHNRNNEGFGSGSHTKGGASSGSRGTTQHQHHLSSLSMGNYHSSVGARIARASSKLLNGGSSKQQQQQQQQQQQRDQMTAVSSNKTDANASGSTSSNSSMGTKADDLKSNSTVAATPITASSVVSSSSSMPSSSEPDSHQNSHVSLIVTEGQGLGQKSPLLSLPSSALLPLQQPQRYKAICESATAAQREAYDSALQTVSYLIKYHHATRGAVIVWRGITLLHSDLGDDAITKLLCAYLKLQSQHPLDGVGVTGDGSDPLADNDDHHHSLLTHPPRSNSASASSASAASAAVSPRYGKKKRSFLFSALGSSSKSNKDSSGNGLKAPHSPSSSSLPSSSSSSSQQQPPLLPQGADTLTAPGSPSKASDNGGSLSALAHGTRAREESGVGLGGYGQRVGVGRGAVLRGVGQGHGFMSEDWKGVLDFALWQHTSSQQQSGHIDTNTTPVVTAQEVSRQKKQQDAVTMGNDHGEDESCVMGVATSCNSSNNNNNNSNNNSSGSTSSNSMMSRLTNSLGSMMFSAPKSSSSDSHIHAADAAGGSGESAAGSGDHYCVGSGATGVVSLAGDEIWCRRIHRKRLVCRPSVDKFVHSNNHPDIHNHCNGSDAVASANGSNSSECKSAPASVAAVALSEEIGRLVVYVQGSVTVLLLLSGDGEICYDPPPPPPPPPPSTASILSDTCSRKPLPPLSSSLSPPLSTEPEPSLSCASGDSVGSLARVRLPSLHSVCQSFQLAVAAEIDLLAVAAEALGL